MTPPKPNPIVRFLPSLTDVAFLMPVAFLFLGMQGAARMLEGDTGWHVRTGEWILANGQVPYKDIFSFTMPNQPWFAWEWLWDVAFAWLYQHGGMAAVVLTSIFVLCLTFALLFRVTQRKCGNVLIAIAMTFAAVGGSSIHWLARPHLFTLLFVVIFYFVLERASEGKTRLLLVLPVLSVLWTNLHGGFFLGVLLAVTYALGELTSSLIEADPERRTAARKRARPFLVTAVGCFLASFINPYGYHLHEHIYGYLTDAYHLRNINEFLSISFQHPLARFFEVMLAFGAVAAFWNLYRRRFVYAFLLVGFSHLALFSARNIPIFLIVAAPIVASTLHELLLDLREAPVARWLQRAAASVEDAAADFGAVDRLWRLHVTSVLAAAVLIAIFYAPAPPKKFRAEYDPKGYPDNALALLRSPEFAKSIFTNDEWGDYLIYRLYPNTKVFVDGRSDFYGSEFGQMYIDTINVKYGWQQNLDRYGVDTVLLPVDVPMAGALKESKRWSPVYDDGMAIVFRSAAAPERGTSSMVSQADGNRHDREVMKPNSCRREIAKSDERRKHL
jgi:hypothetical protein